MAIYEAPPSAEQIVDVLEYFLQDDVSPELGARKQFRCRVALNLLGILRRELTQRDAVTRQQRARLQDILGTDEHELSRLNKELANQIRFGKVELDDERIAQHVRLAQREHLSISNPKWLDEQADPSLDLGSSKRKD